MFPRRFLVASGLLMLTALFGCGSKGPRIRVKPPPPGPRVGRRGTAFFAGPKTAVPAIRAMLRAKDWPKLARYYDLTGTQIPRQNLVSGQFFYRSKRPRAGHPAGFWRYKHPFAPPYQFHHQEDAPTPGVVIVVMHVAIDQGGGMIQRGQSRFRMIRHPRGWQILPPLAP